MLATSRVSSGDTRCAQISKRLAAARDFKYIRGVAKTGSRRAECRDGVAEEDEGEGGVGAGGGGVGGAGATKRARRS